MKTGNTGTTWERKEMSAGFGMETERRGGRKEGGGH
jgi:hypothetical protein